MMKREFNLVDINWEPESGDMSIIFRDNNKTGNKEINLLLIQRENNLTQTQPEVRIVCERIDNVYFTKFNFIDIFNKLILNDELIYDFYYSDGESSQLIKSNKIISRLYKEIKGTYQAKPYNTQQDTLAIFITPSPVEAEIINFKYSDKEISGDISLKRNKEEYPWIKECDYLLIFKKRISRNILEYKVQVSFNIYQKQQTLNRAFTLDPVVFSNFSLKHEDVWEGFLLLKNKEFTREIKLTFNYENNFPYISLNDKIGYNMKPFQSGKDNFGIFIRSNANN